MTGSAASGRRVVYLGGYAGRGRYEDGTRASVERILTIAQNQHRNAGLDWTCFEAAALVSCGSPSRPRRD
ncbi:MAG: hypothetical protein ACRDRX_27625 [Pseudonocardiaceae bacterium]